MEEVAAMAETPKPVRRIVAGNDTKGKAVVLSDGPSPDVRTDPARPGFVSTRIWVTDGTPAKTKGIRETLDLPHTLEPPPDGSVCRVVTFPPDAWYIQDVKPRHVASYFESMGSPNVSTYGPEGPHPYMQKTRTVDFCHVLEGEIILILDTEEVLLKAGDTLIQRGTNHAWSNRSDQPCTIIFCQHDATFEAP
jgi:mannose-6-phosphate isomerase-like protein (cupin superfamily)